MKVIVFGGTGMIGLGVVRECLLDPEVTQVVIVARTAEAMNDVRALRDVPPASFAKIEERILPDVTRLGADVLAGCHACFFCLGVSSAGMSEQDYRRITYDLTIDIAKLLVKASPQTTFIYVSGHGTDATETGSTMWARVKGQTENALLKMPFHAVCMFRPGLVRPLHGIRSKTPLYRAAYLLLAPFYALLALLAPQLTTTTEAVGRAMLRVAKGGPPARIVESQEINRLARGSHSASTAIGTTDSRNGFA